VEAKCRSSDTVRGVKAVGRGGVRVVLSGVEVQCGGKLSRMLSCRMITGSLLHRIFGQHEVSTEKLKCRMVKQSIYENRGVAGPSIH